jgi:hypothetical protein
VEDTHVGESARRPRHRLSSANVKFSNEVAFYRGEVTDTDRLTYAILDITETPEAFDIVLIKWPELQPAGVGESSIRPVAATPSSTRTACACAAPRSPRSG